MPELDGLEARLVSLGSGIDWPPTPALSVEVMRRITPQRHWYESRLELAAAAAIILAAALLAYTPARVAIANWLNLHTGIRFTTTLPTLSPLPPGPLGQRLGLGSPTTLQAARAGVSWRVLLPNSLGDPNEVYLQNPADAPFQGEVTLVYTARPGIPVSGQTGVSVLITEARGSVDANYFGKVLGPGTTVEQVSVNGHDGYWISGSPHEFFFDDAAGNTRSETLRLATNTLILDEGGTIVRIEGDLTRDQALAIAASLG